jgi:hypothetical protein
MRLPRDLLGATVLALNRLQPSARPALPHEPDRAQPAPDFCASRRWRVRRHGCQNPAPSAASPRPLNPVHSKASEVRGRRTLSPALLPADLLLRRVPAAATGPAHRSAPTNSATRCPPAPRRSRRADLPVTAHRTVPRGPVEDGRPAGRQIGGTEPRPHVVAVPIPPGDSARAESARNTAGPDCASGSRPRPTRSRGARIHAELPVATAGQGADRSTDTAPTTTEPTSRARRTLGKRPAEPRTLAATTKDYEVSGALS